MPSAARAGHPAVRAAGGLPGADRAERAEGDGIASTLLEARARLAAELLRLRLEAGLSTRELAGRLRWSQSRVSRAETARLAVPVPDVEAWCRATDARGLVPELTELALHALTEALSFRRRGSVAERLARQQREIAALEEQSGVVRCYHPVLLPSMAQTPDYLRLILAASHPNPDADLAPAIAARMERRRLLEDLDRRWEFVVPEVAMRWHFGNAPVQADALTRLRELAALPNVLVGLLPLATGTAVWHANGFNLYDELPEGDAIVHVGTLTTAVNVTDPPDVDRYRQAFARLRDASLTGAAAEELISHVQADLLGTC